MSNRKTIWILFLVVISCVYLNSSSIFAFDNDEEIKAVLQKYQKAFNEKDAKNTALFYHPNARIKTGGSSGYVSRQEYEKILPERMEKLGKLEFYDLDIDIKANTATVNAINLFSKTGKRIKVKYTMILEEGKWWIIGQDY